MNAVGIVALKLSGAADLLKTHSTADRTVNQFRRVFKFFDCFKSILNPYNKSDNSFYSLRWGGENYG
jgi:hypothetical protein